MVLKRFSGGFREALNRFGVALAGFGLSWLSCCEFGDLKWFRVAFAVFVNLLRVPCDYSNLGVISDEVQ